MGNLFQDYRNTLGIDIETVSEKLKISKFYLKAIEKDDFAKLPGDVYARGYIREYARFLGIKAEDALRGYTGHLQCLAPDSTTDCTEAKTERLDSSLTRQGWRSGMLVRLVAGAALLLICYLSLPAKNTFTHMVAQSIDSVVSREQSYYAKPGHFDNRLRTVRVSGGKRSDNPEAFQKHLPVDRTAPSAAETEDQLIERDGSDVSQPLDLSDSGIDYSGQAISAFEETGAWMVSESLLAGLSAPYPDNVGMCNENPSLLWITEPGALSSTCNEGVQMPYPATCADCLNGDDLDLNLLSNYGGPVLFGLLETGQAEAICSSSNEGMSFESSSGDDLFARGVNLPDAAMAY